MNVGQSPQSSVTAISTDAPWLASTCRMMNTSCCVPGGGTAAKLVTPVGPPGMSISALLTRPERYPWNWFVGTLPSVLTDSVACKRPPPTGCTLTCTGGRVAQLAACAAFVTPALLFAGFGSCSLPVTLALLVSAPACVGCTTMWIVALAPAARLPRPHASGFGAPHAPWLGRAEMNRMFAGNWSVTVTPVAGEGPLFVTVSV
jgi:hypothetical protein